MMNRLFSVIESKKIYESVNLNHDFCYQLQEPTA
ncbi:hypothetical protein J2S14_004407 [Lederbergia wuyishanensis]|uniref:Uncharacterized protein n=1 Tax=Lederbergia wuyishanensis TaxID=1347903 RepID=A0ABU0DB42_9BACI|nr:hypothetical protein [Lederbergia wuyishanensis]